MPDAITDELADAVASVIDGASLSQSVTPEVSYGDWEFDLKNLATLQVDVWTFTKNTKHEALTGGRLVKYLYPVHIAVRKKVTRSASTGKVPRSEVKPLNLLVQEIVELFLLKRISGYEEGYSQDDPVILESPISAHLRTMSQFTGIIRIPFEVQKQL